MKSVFLYGDVSNNFEDVSIPFIQASGGSSARIALLLQGGPEWEKYVPRYRDPWMRIGAEEVIPIAPTEDSSELDAEASDLLKQCTGIFIAGGDTRIYRNTYANERIGTLIKTLHESGVPYGGVSAGALIAPEKCTILGGKVTTPINEYIVRAREHLDLTKGNYVELSVDKGIGILKDCIIEAHFSEFGGFPRLVQAMELTKSTYGFGIDEPICLEILDGTSVKVHGRGRAYTVKRIDSLKFKIIILEPGDHYEIKR